MPLSKQTFKTFWLSLFFGGLISLFLIWPSSTNKIIMHWIQPESVKYDDFRYRLSIVETNTKNPIINIIFDAYRHYEIFISKQSVKPELDYMYSHYKEYGFNTSVKNISQLLETCEVIWKPDGVWFIEPSGHKLFFPTKSFVGGR